MSLVFLKRKNYSIYLFPQHNKRTGYNSLSLHRGVSSCIFLTHALLYTLFVLSQVESDTPTAKARWVLMYIDFQIYSKAYKTNLFP